MNYAEMFMRLPTPLEMEEKMLKLKPSPFQKKLTPPEQVEKTYTFTYSELHLLLRLFGTHVAVMLRK
jgi:hypothetical protein